MSAVKKMHFSFTLLEGKNADFLGKMQIPSPKRASILHFEKTHALASA
jgi:hypothetical protein